MSVDHGADLVGIALDVGAGELAAAGALMEGEARRTGDDSLRLDVAALQIGQHRARLVRQEGAAPQLVAFVGRRRCRRSRCRIGAALGLAIAQPRLPTAFASRRLHLADLPENRVDGGCRLYKGIIGIITRKRNFFK